ncbi:hypothetical protein [Phycobacter sp. K97]|uniref:hypothetical protein n=1 Tax=Phycobacter sedimenti TaxID=3133977 RepID=UPI00311E7D53
MTLKVFHNGVFQIAPLVRLWAAACLAIGLLVAPARAVELVMVEQHGCEWCARWNEEIAPIYPKTAEGAFAPLRRVDLRNLPSDLNTTRRVNFTPTFLIVKDGHEIARLEGYPGEDFFWPLLEAMLRDHAGFLPGIEGNDS